jgi:predicted RecB family nuclease
LQRLDDRILHSASDLVHFLECGHRTTLDLQDLDDPQPKAQDDEHAQLIQRKGVEHEKRFLQTLRTRHARVVDITEAGTGNALRAAATLDAMRDGVDVVFQATLLDGDLIGHADFLRRVPGPSRFGDWRYEVLDTKLARRERAKFLVQLAFYSRLLGRAQQADPALMHVVLGNDVERAFRCADYSRYVDHQLGRYLARVASDKAGTYPDPCEACAQCRWRDRCDAQRVTDDHLSQVARITTLQVRRLQDAGVPTLAALAGLPDGTSVPRIQPETLARLHPQAVLQLRARQDGGRHLELLPPDPDGQRGFARLPAPDPGDLFFDMEGDPLDEGGLEYLFGVWGIDVDEARPAEEGFRAFWATDRIGERRAFEAFMDFVSERVLLHPGAHVYHYASYEASALKRLMCSHGSREAEVDQLLREHRLVDLYTVVREALRISEPAYSIKNVERFYREARAGEVKDGSASIVWFERWRESGDAALLQQIEAYNREDVVSTRDLHRWLIGLRPAGMAWRTGGDEAVPAGAALKPPSPHRIAIDSARIVLEALLPSDPATWTELDRRRELTAQLLDFHRRAHKPAWWATFDRQTWSDEALIEDVECLGGLVIDAEHPPVKDKQSVVWTYTYPEQDSKLGTGDDAVVTFNRDPVNSLQIDEATRRVRFRHAAKRGVLPDRIALGPADPISSKALEAAIVRFAASVEADDGRYPVIEALLDRHAPRITGRPDGEPIVDAEREALPQIIDAIARLDRSAVFVQGPPGSGKTYTGSHVIAELLARGCSVGVSSNSHKAIHNLLAAVEKVAAERGQAFRGAKKSSGNNPDSVFQSANIQSFEQNDDIIGAGYQLVAGTAWLFADPGMDRSLDYLFVDEASQVSLANLVATATCARNVVLLGDQMQLGQPTQGVHPGRSGDSSLEYLLDGVAAIAPNRGIFLKDSFRMHPDLCGFLSEAVYDGRLASDASTHAQRLLLDAAAHPALQPTGLRFVPVTHDARAQYSHEEAEIVRTLLESLLTQRYRDGNNRDHPLTLDDILVVAPYNLQVNLLKRVLPAGARVGTVDKFQGQEAQMAIVSMATSSGEYLPRSMAFLYSKNRLNVAMSRARCLAVMVASPRLLDVSCGTAEEMGLVNLLCWVADVSANGPGRPSGGIGDAPFPGGPAEPSGSFTEPCR